MSDKVHAYPLAWPPGWPRNRSPQYSRFDTTLAKARDGVYRELGLLGATGVVISSNAVLLRSGEIAARQPRIEDTGVCVYFVLAGQQRAIPCDRWVYVQDNLRAVELTIGALRGIDRWGTGEIVAAAFRGFAALPEGGSAAWWRVLEVAPDASEVEVEAAYRALAKRHHPDAGGSGERFRAVAEAYRRAKGRATA